MFNGQGWESGFRQGKRHITRLQRNSWRLYFTVWWGVARDYIFKQMNDIDYWHQRGQTREGNKRQGDASV